MKRTGIKRKARKKADDFSADVRRRAMAVLDGRCVVAVIGQCDGFAHHVHHRKLRRSGDHSFANALAVCRSCHNLIHLYPEWAMRHGLIVPQHEDPATIEWTHFPPPPWSDNE